MQFLQAQQRIKVFLGGRGSGKTTAEGGAQYQHVVEMPRSKGFLSSTTYNQLLTKTLPAMEAKWQEMGFVEGEDYLVGRRPPKTWETPLAPPRKYDNIVSWANGRCIELLSMDRPDLARGGSYTDGAIDEAGLVAKDHVNRVLLPSIRGHRLEYNTYLYGNLRVYTSVPWKPSGYWVFDYEEKAKADPARYLFLESNAWDNVDVLGAEYIHMLEEELPYLEFLIEVMNKRIRKSKEAFYHKFDPDHHTYTVSYLYGEGERGIITNGAVDPHYKSDELLELSFDFSGWFNCCAAFQEGKIDKQMTEFCLHQFFVKQDEGKVAELVDKICNHYSRHRAKMVRIWGEPRGHDKNPTSTDTIYQSIAKRFTQQGWRAEIRVPVGQVKQHKERNYYINDLLAETTPTLPLLRFNDATCKDMIISMQAASITGDFQKDKGKEKDREFPQEHATHFTDLVDYYLMQKHAWRVKSGRSRLPMTATVQ